MVIISQKEMIKILFWDQILSTVSGWVLYFKIMSDSMRNLTHLLLLICSFLIFSCEKDEETHPKILTIGAEPTSGSSVKLTGNVLAVGSIKVIEYGFVINNGYHIERKIPMSGTISPGIFELEATGFSGANTVRAYIKNEKGTAYGENLSFTMPDPTFSSISPSKGKTGDRVTIYGSNLPVDKNNIKVKFQESYAQVVEVNAESIIVEVPEGAYSYYYNNVIPVSVIINDYHYYPSFEFTLLPSITDFEPKSGTIGTTVTIAGSYLYYQNINIYFNDIESYAYVANNNMLQAVVPHGINTEKVKIKVLYAGVVHEFAEDFTIIPPTINSFTPSSGLSGSLVTVTGVNFANFGSNIVSFGDILVETYYNSQNEFSFYVPGGLDPGNYKIKINTGIHSVTSAENFSLVSPEITGFSPSSGSQGTIVTINGNFLMDNNLGTSVRFGSYETYVISGNANSLQVEVPFGVTPGKMKLSVTTGGQTVNSAEDFTAIEPSITSFVPNSGTPGTKITITGTGFGTSTYNTTIYFGNTAISPLTSTNTSIEVLVPSNAGDGEKALSVYVHGTNITTSKKFTIL